MWILTPLRVDKTMLTEDEGGDELSCFRLACFRLDVLFSFHEKENGETALGAPPCQDLQQKAQSEALASRRVLHNIILTVRPPQQRPPQQRCLRM